MISTVSDIYP